MAIRPCKTNYLFAPSFALNCLLAKEWVIHLFFKSSFLAYASFEIFFFFFAEMQGRLAVISRQVMFLRLMQEAIVFK